MRHILLSVVAGMLCACRFDPSGLAIETEDATVQPVDASRLPDATQPTDAPGPGDGALPVDADITPFCDSANPDLVACYRFDDGTGQDASQYGNDLMLSNTTFASERSGMALRTSAAGQATAAESASLDVDALTIEAWVNPDVLPATGRVGLVDNEGQYSVFLYDGDRVRCSAAGEVYVNHQLPIGQWTHVACTADGNQLSVWINGAMVGSAASGAINKGGTDGMTVAMNSPSGENFTGLLDDIRIWRVARSADDICAAAGAACTATLR